MSIDQDEWAALSAEWRAESPAPTRTRGDAATARLRNRVRRHTRRQWLLLASEIALTAYFVVFAWDAVREPGGRGIVPAVVTIGVIVLVWTFVIRNRRGSWRQEGESTSDYLRLSHVRAAVGRRTIRFVQRAMVVGALCYAPWFALRWREGAISGAEWWRWVFLLVYLVGFWYWSIWQSRRIDKEMTLLDEIERDLRDDESRVESTDQEGR